VTSLQVFKSVCVTTSDPNLSRDISGFDNPYPPHKTGGFFI
jgi:hypothetical protein